LGFSGACLLLPFASKFDMLHGQKSNFHILNFAPWEKVNFGSSATGSQLLPSVVVLIWVEEVTLNQF
jgi:hypothetical protein